MFQTTYCSILPAHCRHGQERQESPPFSWGRHAVSATTAVCTLVVPYWFSARICGSILAMAMFVGPAFGQGGEQADVTAPTKSGQKVTLTDLAGVKIHTKLVTEMMVRRQGRQFPASQEVERQIYMELDGRITFSSLVTAHSPRGTRATPVRGTTVKLDEPWFTENGEAVWQFKDGDLTFVRSYEGGALRTIISLKRDGQNLTCAVGTVYARERSKNSIVMNSPIDGVPVTILSWKPISSTCKVARETAK